MQFYQSHPLVARVGPPMLENHPSHALARKLLPKGAGSVFSFDIKASADKANASSTLKLFITPGQWRDCPPAGSTPSTTHFR